VNIYRVSRIRIRVTPQAWYAPPTWWPPPVPDKGPAAVGDYETLPLYDIEVWQLSSTTCMRAPSFCGEQLPGGRTTATSSCRRAPLLRAFGREACRLVAAKEEVTK